MLRYVAIFALTYAVIIMVCAGVAQFLDIGAFGSIAALIGGALVAGSRFIDAHRRAPHAREIHLLVWGSLAASLLVSALLAGLLMLLLMTADEGALLLQTLQALTPTIWLFGFLAVAILSLLVLYGSYAGHARVWTKRHPGTPPAATPISETSASMERR